MKWSPLLIFALALSISTSLSYAVGLPQTGQVSCYSVSGSIVPCLGTGQDGDWLAGVPSPNPRFTTGSGIQVDCIIDSLTGLMWMKAPIGVSQTWQSSLDYANGLDLCGCSDWRMPSFIELQSLVNGEEANSAAWLNAQGFSNVLPAIYWASTSAVFSMNYAWTAAMDDGATGEWYKNDTKSSWAVRDARVVGATQPPKTGQRTCYSAFGTLASCAGTGQDGDLQSELPGLNLVS